MTHRNVRDLCFRVKCTNMIRFFIFDAPCFSQEFQYLILMCQVQVSNGIWILNARQSQHLPVWEARTARVHKMPIGWGPSLVIILLKSPSCTGWGGRTGRGSPTIEGIWCWICVGCCDWRCCWDARIWNKFRISCLISLSSTALTRCPTSCYDLSNTGWICVRKDELDGQG